MPAEAPPPSFGPELSVHHEALDAQHREVFEALEAAVAALDGPRVALEAAVARFADATLSHLAAEEALMEEALYPDRGRHRTAHEMFVSDLVQLRAELAEKGPTPVVGEWLRTRLPEWLRFHIRVNDVPVAEHLARKRSAGEPRARRPDRRLS
jgi:hemerythrin-like metal-binding protein